MYDSFVLIQLSSMKYQYLILRYGIIIAVNLFSSYTTFKIAALPREMFFVSLSLLNSCNSTPSFSCSTLSSPRLSFFVVRSNLSAYAGWRCTLYFKSILLASQSIVTSRYVPLALLNVIIMTESAYSCNEKVVNLTVSAVFKLGGHFIISQSTIIQGKYFFRRVSLGINSLKHSP